MDTLQFLNLRKTLKENQELVLRADNSILIREQKATGGYKVKCVGKLEDFPKENIRMKTKLWASVSSPAIKSFSKFGEPLPKRDNNDYEVRLLVQLIQQRIGTNFVVKSTWTDTFMKFTYDVYSWGNVKLYCYGNTPRYIDMGDGNKIIIAQKLPELKTEIFRDGE